MQDRAADRLAQRLADQLGLNAVPQIFFASAALAVLFIAFAIPFHAAFAAFFGRLTTFTVAYFGWFYVLSVTGLLGFLIWVALSRYGHIRLSADDEQPEYGTLTWFSMLFAAGIGTVLMFWGVAEPMSHFANPPLQAIAGGTPDAAKLAMTIALYHFGLHTWTIFTLPALAIGDFTYRQGLPMRISSVFYAVLVATGSVALGLDRGIKRLSLFNIAIALVILLFVWIAGPTLFITSGIVQNFGAYLQNLPWLAFTVVWFSVFGLAAIDLELHHGVALAAQVQDDVSVALFSFLGNYPLATLTSLLSVVIIIVFLTTSADSAALVVDLLSSRADRPSHTGQRVFWTLLLGAIAATLLLGGGLDALQNVITTLGFPFCVLLVFMAVALTRALHADYLGYSLEDLSAGRAPSIDPMGSDDPEAIDRADLLPGRDARPEPR